MVITFDLTLCLKLFTFCVTWYINKNVRKEKEEEEILVNLSEHKTSNMYTVTLCTTSLLYGFVLSYNISEVYEGGKQ